MTRTWKGWNRDKPKGEAKNLRNDFQGQSSAKFSKGEKEGDWYI